MAQSNGNASGFHTLLVGPGLRFTVPKRYSKLQFINAGAQGAVVSAYDSITKICVAIKKLDRPMQYPSSALRTIREFALLTSVKHPNVVRILSVFTPQKKRECFKDVYLVMELMTHNLDEVRKKKRLDHKTLSFFFYQILCGVNHLHRQGIVHRDLKPSNLAINKVDQVKVLDFGLARLFTPTIADQMTKYVVTRYYRAPELIFELPYNEKVDVWSIGCIFAEMITGNVLFPGGKTTQWDKIVNIMGTPNEIFISQLSEQDASRENSRQITPKSIEEILPDHNFIEATEEPEKNMTASNARRLIARMLAIDPKERYSTEQALHDPYVKHWFQEAEINAPLSNKGYDAKLDEKKLTLEELKSLIFDEVKLIESSHDVHHTAFDSYDK